jgi:hypothetical protein
MHLPVSRLLATALVLLPALAACGDDGGTGPARLTPDQVGAEYRICSLTFTPDGGSPPALDIRGAVMDTAADSGAVLRVGRTVESFELEYLKKGDVLRPRFQGSYGTGESDVTLSFAGGSEVTSTLLLPQKLKLVFQASPRKLGIQSDPFYTVSRTDYERVAGKGFPNARDQITGTLAGTFSEGACN